MADEKAPQVSPAGYQKLWGKDNVQTTTQVERNKRNENAQEIVSAYYDFASDMYQAGWSDHFHFCRFRAGESIDVGLKRHEHFMAMMTEMKPGMRILELGSGVGAPAREIASFTGAHVTGINLNKFQLARSRGYDKELGMLDQVDYVEADYMKMPFADNTFDVVYALEATCYATTLEGVYGEALRVLKPGGVFGTYEFIMTSKYDDENPTHREIRSRIEQGTGCCNLTNPQYAFESMKRAGFEDVWHQDLAPLVTQQYLTPWWWAINGDTRYATTFGDWVKAFFMKEWCFNIMLLFWKFLNLFGLAPDGIIKAMETVGMGTFGMRDGAKIGIFTTQELLIGRKPGKKEKRVGMKML